MSERWSQPYLAAIERLFTGDGLHPRSRIVTLNEPAIQIHLLEVGEGEPLVLIHGGGGTAADWAPLAARLAGRYHLYLLEMPGHGLSAPVDFEGVEVRRYAAQFLHALLTALGIPRAGFVANSLGGYWAVAFALAHPEQVSRVILTGAPGGLETRVPFFFRLMSVWGIGRVMALLATRPGRSMVRRVLGMVGVAADRVPDAYIDVAWHAARLPGRVRSYRSLVRQLSPFPGPARMRPIWADARRLQLPILFIWGERDAFGAPVLAREYCTAVPAARLALVRGAGHLPWLDEPDQVARLTLSAEA